MINETIAQLIQKGRLGGKAKEVIYLELLQAGHKLEDIETAYLSSAQTPEDAEILHVEAHKKTIRVVVGFGVTLVAAGIFSIVASNWQNFSKTVKISIIYFFFFASYFGGWRLTEFYKLPRLGNSLYYLGSLIFGAGIMLIGQMFNVQSNWPDAFLIWMLGVMAMAYFSEMFGMFFLALPIGLTAIIGYPITFFDDLGMFSGHNSLILTSTLLLLVVSLSTFVAGALVRKRALAELAPEDNY